MVDRWATDPRPTGCQPSAGASPILGKPGADRRYCDRRCPANRLSAVSGRSPCRWTTAGLPSPSHLSS